MGDVVFSEFCGEIEISLTKCRSPAAAPIFRKRNFEPERFQHSYRSKADVRFVIAHKGIVPEDDFAESGERRRLARCFWRVVKNRPVVLRAMGTYRAAW